MRFIVSLLRAWSLLLIRNMNLPFFSRSSRAKTGPTIAYLGYRLSLKFYIGLKTKVYRGNTSPEQYGLLGERKAVYKKKALYTDLEWAS